MSVLAAPGVTWYHSGMEYAIAILDVGKTNKKLLVFDDHLQLLDSMYRTFPPIKHNGVPIEDLEGLLAWFFEQLKALAGKYPIRAIACSTHGAAFVGVDEQGRQTVPLVDYTYEPGEDFHRRFYEQVGDKHELQRTTATLELKALINPAKALFFVQSQFPDEFARTRWFLPFPSFFSMQLTGEAAAEWTYVGNHTYLWDFHENRWSQVAERLGIVEQLPQRIERPWQRLGAIRPELASELGLSRETVVPFGIHDSNASLLPYLLNEREPFLLNSTGTWCVVMRPAAQVQFAESEIGKSVFYNLSAFGRPVKTAILMAGLEFETYTGILRSLHGTDRFPDFDPEVYRRVIEARSDFILPSIVMGSGQFPDAQPRVTTNGETYPFEEIRAGTRVPPFFADFETAFAVLNLSIAIQSKVAFERVEVDAVRNVYTEGGFRNNRDYNATMAGLFPQHRFSLTGIAEASAFGAAMIAKLAHDDSEPEALRPLLKIDKEGVPGVELDGLEHYVDTYLRHLIRQT